MSRSRKAPYIKDGYKSKWKRKAKQQANQAVRNETSVTNGGAYKKVSNSWDICDFIFYEPNEPKYSRK